MKVQCREKNILRCSTPRHYFKASIYILLPESKHLTVPKLLKSPHAHLYWFYTHFEHLLLLSSVVGLILPASAKYPGHVHDGVACNSRGLDSMTQEVFSTLMLICVKLPIRNVFGGFCRGETWAGGHQWLQSATGLSIPTALHISNSHSTFLSSRNGTDFQKHKEEA